MSARPAAPRHRFAVDQLRLDGHEAVLEIGCGPGVTATLVADALPTGRYLGIDRSAKAIAAASSRNRAHVDAGRAAFEVADVLGYEPEPAAFDRVVAMHVRALLEPVGDRGLAAVRAALGPAGTVHLVWEPFAGVDPAGVVAEQARALTDAGFSIVRSVVEPCGATVATCVVARPS